MINFKLAREIYGLTPWMMDIHSIPVMTSVLNDLKNGVSFEKVEVKLNTPFLMSIESQSKDVRYIQRPYQLRNEDDFEAVGIIKIDGPITKNGGESTMGMKQISGLMKSMARDSRVKSFVILGDSGGGSSAAVELMVDTINEVKKTKSVIGCIEKGGYLCSAAYGIFSACHEIYSESGMNIVGSCGTMIQFEGRAANTIDKDGKKHIRLYATSSVKKNEAFEEALNNDNYELIVNDVLNPVNNNFIDMISANRSQLQGFNFGDGKDYFAKDVVGSLIDGIKSFEEIVDLSLNYSMFANIKETSVSSKKLKSQKNMTREELKAGFPLVFNEIVNEGVEQRKRPYWSMDCSC